MKKSTYIIIGVLSLLILATFFGPAIMFKKRDLSQVLDDNTLTAPVTTAPFSSLSVEFEKWPIIAGDPFIEITETDSAASPTVTLTKALNDNATMSVENGRLEIIIDLHTADPGNSAANHVQWIGNSTPMAIVKVPKGMLKNASAEYINLRLSGFTSTLETDCNRLSIANGSRLPLLKVTGTGTNADISTDTSSRIDTLVTAQSGNCGIDLSQASVATILNRPADKATTTLILSSPTEIKP